MYRIIHGTTHGLQDVTRLVEQLNTLARGATPELRSWFDPQNEVFVTRAPGRLDVMGGIADYSGSLVLQLPLKEATCAALQLTPARTLRLVSWNFKTGESPRRFEMPLEDFEAGGPASDYVAAQKYFRGKQWAAYVAGAFLVLMKERNVSFKTGADILISSEVPEGKGVSSSAALEVAAMTAIAAAYQLDLSAPELARLCQKVENLIVGAPCGIMDQMTSACGKAQQLLSLLCQPATLQKPIAIPEHLTFCGIDSGVAHSVSGSDYTSVRVGAFMGYRMIAELAHCKVTPSAKPQHVRIEDAKWQGYLANITPSLFEQEYARHLPEEMLGSSFLERYHGFTDEVTNIKPKVVYRITQPTAHPIYEHFRVRTFAELLHASPNLRASEQLGELMYQSHASYSACDLGARGTDRLVALARELGPARGIYGAKITGGGSGGTVALLAAAHAERAMREICDRYAEETRQDPKIFNGSSMGAGDFGYLVLRS